MIRRAACLASSRSLSLSSCLHSHSPRIDIAFQRFQFLLSARHAPAQHAAGSGTSRFLSVSRVRTAAESSVNSPASLLSGELRKRNGIARLYLQLLEKRPILTKSTTAATIYFLADMTSQGISIFQADDAEKVEWNAQRTLRMVATGFFMSGPTLHIWFNLLSRIYPKRDLPSTLKKMVLGQTVYGPTFTVIFFSLNAFIQGESMDEVIARLKRDFIPTIKSGLMYWPLCDFITYRYVPVHLQPLVSNSFSYVWTIYFTYMACLKKVAPSPCVEVQ